MTKKADCFIVFAMTEDSVFWIATPFLTARNDGERRIYYLYKSIIPASHTKYMMVRLAWEFFWIASSFYLLQ
ncbi:MAG: hypothetical protein LBP54_03030 [Campylobacteraceae bacterium]|jgi:hypothetical protein|nr:hypothetical protein [Campylobacteraceae bacterium]